MPLSPGQVLDNRYRVVKLLGQGGFGAVYRVWDIRMDRPMALKENLDTTFEAQQQFKREAQILFDLAHPNLPRVIDHFVISQQGQYLVMEFVEGEDLKDMLARGRGPLPEAQVLEWIGQVCDALTYLHSQNPPIIHRDIKPANIKITPEGKAMLVDFGIAKIYDAHLQTTQGARAVTPGYSPLEQYGRGKTDARSDIYALGATLYTMLTGIAPPESIQLDLGTTLQMPSVINPNVSPSVDRATLKAMQRIPDQRFQSAAEFKTALTRPVQTAVAPAYGPQTSPAAAPPVKPVQGDRSVPNLGPVSEGRSDYVRRSIPWSWIGISALLALVILGIAVIFGGGYLLIDRNEGLAQTQTALAILVNRTPTDTLTNTPTTPQTSTPTEALPTATSSATATTTVPPTATQPPTATSLPAIVVEPYCKMFDESPVYVNANQPVILWWRWDALTAKLVNDHINASIYEIYLDGQRVYAEQMSDIEYISNKQFYRVSWYATVGLLSPGKHLAERYLSWTSRISDGWNTFGPGGEIETEHDICEIIVR